LVLYDLRGDARQARHWLDLAQKDCCEFPVLRRRLQLCLSERSISPQPLLDRLDQLLATQKPGWERAAYLRARSSINQFCEDQQQRRLNLEAAASEPGLTDNERATNLLSWLTSAWTTRRRGL